MKNDQLIAHIEIWYIHTLAPRQGFSGVLQTVRHGGSHLAPAAAASEGAEHSAGDGSPVRGEEGDGGDDLRGPSGKDGGDRAAPVAGKRGTLVAAPAFQGSRSGGIYPLGAGASGGHHRLMARSPGQQMDDSILPSGERKSLLQRGILAPSPAAGRGRGRGRGQANDSLLAGGGAGAGPRWRSSHQQQKQQQPVASVQMEAAHASSGFSPGLDFPLSAGAAAWTAVAKGGGRKRGQQSQHGCTTAVNGNGKRQRTQTHAPLLGSAAAVQPPGVNHATPVADTPMREDDTEDDDDGLPGISDRDGGSGLRKKHGKPVPCLICRNMLQIRSSLTVSPACHGASSQSSVSTPCSHCA